MMSQNRFQQVSAADMWINCALNDTGLKFGTLLDYTFEN